MAGHQRALDPHAEREAGIEPGVDARRLEHDRMHHAAAAPLDPAFGTTRSAWFAAGLRRRTVADPAQQVHLGGRLREREVVGAKSRVHLVAEHRPSEQVERAAQVAHGQPAVDRQALDLVEHRRVRRI